MSTPKHEDLATWLNAGAQHVNPERMQRIRAIAAEGLEEQLAEIRGETLKAVNPAASPTRAAAKRKRPRKAKASAPRTDGPSQADVLVETVEQHPEGALPRVIVDAVLEAHPNWSRTSVANKLAALGREGVRVHVTGAPPHRMYSPGPAKRKR